MQKFSALPGFHVISGSYGPSNLVRGFRGDFESIVVVGKQGQTVVLDRWRRIIMLPRNPKAQNIEEEDAQAESVVLLLVVVKGEYRHGRIKK